MPNIIVIAGANGAGKSTLAPFLLCDTFGITEYVNADTIAQDLAELAIERVRERVRVGGHNIPEDVVKRRYARSLQNFVNLYQPLADSWQVYNASLRAPQKIAFGDKIEGEKIIKQVLWRQIKS